MAPIWTRGVRTRESRCSGGRAAARGRRLFGQALECFREQPGARGRLRLAARGRPARRRRGRWSIPLAREAGSGRQSPRVRHCREEGGTGSCRRFEALSLGLGPAAGWRLRAPWRCGLHCSGRTGGCVFPVQARWLARAILMARLRSVSAGAGRSLFAEGPRPPAAPVSWEFAPPSIASPGPARDLPHRAPKTDVPSDIAVAPGASCGTQDGVQDDFLSYCLMDARAVRMRGRLG